jgi:hypothetical protein
MLWARIVAATHTQSEQLFAVDAADVMTEINPHAASTNENVRTNHVVIAKTR